MGNVHRVIGVIMCLVVMATCRYENYDLAEAAGTPIAVLMWMNDVCQGEHDPIPAYDWNTLNTNLRDGVMLNELINKLLEADGKRPVPFQKKAVSQFMAMTNIETFNQGCIGYGMEKELTFQAGDLWDLRKDKFLNVLNCLHSLGVLASSKGFQPFYTG